MEGLFAVKKDLAPKFNWMTVPNGVGLWALSLVVPDVAEGVACFAKVGFDLCGFNAHFLGNLFVGVAAQPERGGGCLVWREAGHHLYLFPEAVLFAAAGLHGVEGAAVCQVMKLVQVGIFGRLAEGVLHYHLCPGGEVDECGWVGRGAFCEAGEGCGQEFVGKVWVAACEAVGVSMQRAMHAVGVSVVHGISALFVVLQIYHTLQPLGKRFVLRKVKARANELNAKLALAFHSECSRGSSARKCG